MTAGAFGLEQPGNTGECLGTLVRFVSAKISNDNGDGYENAGADPGEVKWVNFHPPFSEPPSFFSFFFLSLKY